MRTDITKINENTPHEELTEGLMVFNGATSKLFNTGEWRTNLYSKQIYANSVCCVHLSARTAVFRWQREKEGNLIMTIVRDVASVPKYVLLMPLR